jgi:hypothetical protein
MEFYHKPFKTRTQPIATKTPKEEAPFGQPPWNPTKPNQPERKIVENPHKFLLYYPFEICNQSPKQIGPVNRESSKQQPIFKRDNCTVGPCGMP